MAAEQIGHTQIRQLAIRSGNAGGLVKWQVARFIKLLTAPVNATQFQQKLQGIGLLILGLEPSTIITKRRPPSALFA
jgi:hypothetical protein